MTKTKMAYMQLDTVMGWIRLQQSQISSTLWSTQELLFRQTWTVDDVTIQYYAGAWGKWQEVNYEPDFLHGFTDHKIWNKKETEQIKNS